MTTFWSYYYFFDFCKQQHCTILYLLKFQKNVSLIFFIVYCQPNQFKKIENHVHFVSITVFMKILFQLVYFNLPESELVRTPVMHKAKILCIKPRFLTLKRYLIRPLAPSKLAHVAPKFNSSSCDMLSHCFRQSFYVLCLCF